ncbi:hypothetical protein [Kitasatospora sp. NPDC058190]|uniref:hypothetical protein n=1 Tax=Kitasatospora sp. NPDC058190 TaxID=3346371 RepID=UPI0036D77900
MLLSVGRRAFGGAWTCATVHNQQGGARVLPNEGQKGQLQLTWWPLVRPGQQNDRATRDAVLLEA